jgi:hypothetical protein
MPAVLDAVMSSNVHERSRIRYDAWQLGEIYQVLTIRLKSFFVLLTVRTVWDDCCSYTIYNRIVAKDDLSRKLGAYTILTRERYSSSAFQNRTFPS